MQQGKPECARSVECELHPQTGAFVGAPLLQNWLSTCSSSLPCPLSIAYLKNLLWKLYLNVPPLKVSALKIVAIHCVQGEPVLIFDCGHYWEFQLHFHIELWTSSSACGLLHPDQPGWEVPDSLLLSTHLFSSWMNCRKWALEALCCVHWGQELEIFSFVASLFLFLMTQHQLLAQKMLLRLLLNLLMFVSTPSACHFYHGIMVCQVLVPSQLSTAISNFICCFLRQPLPSAINNICAPGFQM